MYVAGEGETTTEIDYSQMIEAPTGILAGAAILRENLRYVHEGERDWVFARGWAPLLPARPTELRSTGSNTVHQSHQWSLSQRWLVEHPLKLNSVRPRRT